MKHKRVRKCRAIIWQMIMLSIIFSTTGCYPGESGELHPQAGEGYTVVKKPDGWEAAMAAFDKVSLRIDGSWTEGSVGSEFRIENDSDLPFVIDLAQVKMTILPDMADTRLMTIYDFSSSASKPDGETYDDGKLLYKYYGKEYQGETKPIGETQVSCPPKQKCIFSAVIMFPQYKLNKTKSLQFTLPPIAGRTEGSKITFNCGANGLFG